MGEKVGLETIPDVAFINCYCNFSKFHLET